MTISAKDSIANLMPFVRKVTSKTADKAVRDVARGLYIALIESETDIDQYIKDYNDDKIIDPSCLLKNVDDWHTYIKEDKYIALCDILFQLRPVGLGTPNAMIGEGEAMFLFCSPRVKLSKTKGEGDLMVDGIKSELKGFSFRVMKKLSGDKLQELIVPIAIKYGFERNYVDARGPAKSKRYAFEPWGFSKKGEAKKQDHWKAQFAKVGTKSAKDFMLEVSKLISSSFTTTDINSFFGQDGVFVVENFQKALVVKLFADGNNKWDTFTVLTDKTVRQITKDPLAFEAMIDNGELLILDNYFRSFQTTDVGYYVSFNYAIDDAEALDEENELFQF